MELTDHQLMEAVGRGDEGAFRELVERHQRAVYGTVLRMLGDPFEAEDVAQRVFLRVWQAAPRYRPEAKFQTWLLTIVRHLVFNEGRRLSRQRAVETKSFHPSAQGEEPEQMEADLFDPTQRDPGSLLAQREFREKLDRAIDALPENQRMALFLKAHEDLPYEEIAVVLGISLGATKSLLFRARETLRASLGESFPETF